MLGNLLIANLKMIFRNRQSLFWALVFPLIFLAVFGLFNLDRPPNTNITVIDHSQDNLSHALVQNLNQIQAFTVRERTDEAQARKVMKEEGGQYLLIIPKGLADSVSKGSPVDVTLVYDEGSFTSAVVIGVVQRFLDQVNLKLVQAPSLLRLNATGVIARRLNYFDFLLPGFVGMGVMNYSVIGLATVIALYREQKILKRVLATPLRVPTFFAALIIAYLILSLVQAAIILGAGIAFFHGHIYGNLLYLSALVLLGNLVFLSIGFIVGTIAKTVSAASGLGNAVTVPMMFFSGVFFPRDNLPPILGTIVKYLPLSPMLDAMRGVALEGKPLWDFPQALMVLLAWVMVTSILAVRLFRFD